MHWRRYVYSKYTAGLFLQKVVDVGWCLLKEILYLITYTLYLKEERLFIVFNGEVRQYDELKKEETGMMKPKSFIENKNWL